MHPFSAAPFLACHAFTSISILCHFSARAIGTVWWWRCRLASRLGCLILHDSFGFSLGCGFTLVFFVWFSGLSVVSGLSGHRSLACCISCLIFDRRGRVCSAPFVRLHRLVGPSSSESLLQCPLLFEARRNRLVIPSLSGPVGRSIVRLTVASSRCSFATEVGCHMSPLRIRLS